MSSKKPRSTLKLFINVIAASFLIMALLQAFGPYLEPANPRQAEIVAVEKRIVRVNPQDVISQLREDGKPKMLFIYASWCSYCAKMMPDILTILKERQLGEIQPIFIALGDHPRKLSKYLVNNDYYTFFTPYLLEQDFFKRFPVAMKETGSSFSGSIPYIGFFTPEGKIISDYAGVINQSKLMNMIEALPK